MSLAISAPLTRLTSAWNLLIESLLAEQDFLGHHIHAALRREHAADRPLRFGTLHKEMAGNVVRLLSEALTSGSVPTADGLAYVHSAGESWALHGISLGDLLHDWHTGIDTAVAYVRETGQQLGVEDGELLQFVQSAHTWSHAAVVAAVRGHCGADVERTNADGRRREAFVRGVLFGTLPSHELQAGVEAYGLDPAAEYVAIRARLGDRNQQRKLQQALGFEQSSAGLCAVVDGALVGFLTASPQAETCTVIGVGPRRSLRQLAESYRLASRALTTMQAFGIHGSRDFSAVGLQAAVVGDPDVGDVLRQRYLEPLSVGDSARELLGTLRAYFACDLHVERTATRLFVHQNTVRYRLARFEELTGTSLRSTQVVAELWWALALSDLGA
ncbi:PucR family transcriptional regulator [Smaragdicoccus niigatensis]|uniref:PucR family transcriptional regulator n=1 Tax=Smaragdicoccus niigatensis TaxID=359359 RepID=UPI00037F72CE|nr:helix-turn-helix domain-containing protein [Smaragdicoccus niigatensis]